MTRFAQACHEKTQSNQTPHLRLAESLQRTNISTGTRSFRAKAWQTPLCFIHGKLTPAGLQAVLLAFLFL